MSAPVLSGRAALAGVVGDPVAHSLSPRLMAWLVRVAEARCEPSPISRQAFSASYQFLWSLQSQAAASQAVCIIMHKGPSHDGLLRI